MLLLASWPQLPVVVEGGRQLEHTPLDGCSFWQPVLQVGPEATVEIQITDNQQMAEFDFHM